MPEVGPRDWRLWGAQPTHAACVSGFPHIWWGPHLWTSRTPGSG